MLMKFTRCEICGHLCEEILLRQKHKCCTCNGRRYIHIELTGWQQIRFVLRHPSYLKYVEWL